MIGLPLTSVAVLLVAPLVVVAVMLIHAEWFAEDDSDE
jgi:hypothetical protein|tara:strand:+ start:5099 stop:5212 length:114 start_codon:yes stop_codon:yes gene_type:complete